MIATILDIGVPNKNGRIYPQEAAEAIVQQVAARQAETGFVLGEAGIPMDLTVNLSHVSHQITDARIEDGKLIATIKLLATPMGNVIKELLAAGVQVDFRPRGTGVVDENGVVANYQFISIDAVLEGA